MKLPDNVINKLEKTLDDLSFAKINLEITAHDKKPKYRIVIEQSIIPDCGTSGEVSAANNPA